ncbi:MAG: hypothetical protein KF911_09280 [Pseudomonadales bacterium]|nr:hypothetical protein [Pseudomonadales bacterium]
MNAKSALVVVMALLLGGCAAKYTLVAPGQVSVANKGLVVTATESWNRLPPQRQDAAARESWTRNGPVLEVISFVGGLGDGEALVKQKAKDDRQIPTFRATMSPIDLVSMIESSYRLDGINVFEITSLDPVRFLGTDGILMNFRFVAPDHLPRIGRSVMAIVDRKFYAMTLIGAEAHYFQASLTAWEGLLASARIPR